MSVIVNGRWDEEDFEEERRQVLAKWPTGEDVDFEEACEYLRKLPESKIAYNKFVNAVEEEITMVQPRAGIAPLEAFIDMLRDETSPVREGRRGYQGKREDGEISVKWLSSGKLRSHWLPHIAGGCQCSVGAQAGRTRYAFLCRNRLCCWIHCSVGRRYRQWFTAS